MQFLCEFQDVYWQQNYDSGVVDIPFNITLKRDAELKNRRITKIPKLYNERVQIILVKLETN